jgi:sporulation protein YlmC with PRC-barrel domain
MKSRAFAGAASSAFKGRLTMVFIATIALIVLILALAFVISRRSDRRLVRFKEMTGYAIHGKDGQIGNVHDVYFSDDSWTVRYLVVDTSIWIFGKKVLVSPHAVRRVDLQQQKVFLDLTKSQVENGPELLPDLPLEREQEATYNEYYRWPLYWHIGTLSYHVTTEFKGPAGAGPITERPPIPEEAQGPMPEPRLRSLNSVTQYEFTARGGDIGKANDALIDPRNWTIRYLVVDTNAFLPGGKVLVAPDWIEGIRWQDEKVAADLERQAVETAPEFDLNRRLTRTYERRLMRHYGKNGSVSRTSLPGGPRSR